MESGKFKRFKDDIRRTFTLYALIPVIIITFSSYMISFFIWYRTAVNQNTSINNEISNRIEKIMSKYIDQANSISEQESILEKMNSHDSSIVYQKLYGFVNFMDVRCNFFIFDGSMNPIISSTKNIPEYALKENMFSWGITRRMFDNPSQAVIEKQYFGSKSEQALSVGKAIMKDDKIEGFVTFDLDERDLSRIISKNFSIDVIITDKYTNVISTTNELITNKFGKIDESFRGKSGFIKADNDSYYTTKSNILNGNISVYKTDKAEL